MSNILDVLTLEGQKKFYEVWIKSIEDNFKCLEDAINASIDSKSNDDAQIDANETKEQPIS